MLLTPSSAGTWNKNVTSHWSVASSLDKVIRQMEIGDSELLPDLSPYRSLILTSDYGGQHKTATHETFSFLVAGLESCAKWNVERQHVRDRHLLTKRRMSYKALNDRQRRLALLPFLSAADRLPGLLFTALVNKRVSRTFKVTAEDRLQLPTFIAEWPDQVLRKLMLVAHLGALLIAGLSSTGQNLLWFTDNDDFVANDQRVINLTPILGEIVGGYVGHALGHFRFGTTKCDAGDLQIEDLTAIPDLIAGAACEIPVHFANLTSAAMSALLWDHVSAKSLTILDWMGRKHMPLKRLLILVDEGDKPGTIKVKALETFTDPLDRALG